MDNENIRIEFVNGSSITSIRRPTAFSTVASDVFFPTDQYELIIENGRLEIKKKEAPDFGELSPSQELNDFVTTLAQGE